MSRTRSHGCLGRASSALPNTKAPSSAHLCFQSSAPLLQRGPLALRRRDCSLQPSRLLLRCPQLLAQRCSQLLRRLRCRLRRLQLLAQSRHLLPLLLRRGRRGGRLLLQPLQLLAQRRRRRFSRLLFLLQLGGGCRLLLQLAPHVLRLLEPGGGGGASDAVE